MATANEAHLEKLRKRQAYNVATGYASYKKYEKTKKGKLMRAYRNMQSRVQGIQWRKAHLYLGKELLPREEFYAWAMASEDFHRLYDEWVLSGYARRLAPSVDRIDPKIGYCIENMRWLTHSENSRLGGLKRTRPLPAAPLLDRDAA